MSKYRYILLIMLLAASMAKAEVKYITQDEFRARVFDYRTEREWCYRDTVPCIIDFYTTWCGPCKRLAPIMDSLSHVYDGRVLFYKADTERERELAYVFRIESIPQVLYVPTSGQPTLLKGLYPAQRIDEIINTLLLK